MRVFIALACLCVAGCATITADSAQNITVITEPAGAACGLKNNAGEWNIDRTPGTVAVKRSFSPLIISCNADNAAGIVTVQPKTRGRAYGNIALGGVPAIVDASTGDGYEYEADTVTIPLN